MTAPSLAAQTFDRIERDRERRIIGVTRAGTRPTLAPPGRYVSIELFRDRRTVTWRLASTRRNLGHVLTRELGWYRSDHSHAYKGSAVSGRPESAEAGSGVGVQLTFRSPNKFVLTTLTI